MRTENGDPRTVRLPLMTLVAACGDASGVELAGDTVRFLTQTHSARALIILASGDGPDSIEADLAMHVGVGDARGEEVRLTVTGTPALHLVSVVGPLLAPDRPVFLWLVGAPPLDQAFGQDAIAICERLIIDTGAYANPRATLTMLANVAGPEGTVALADLAWARSRQWRELIAQSFDGPPVRRFVHAVERVTVAISGDDASAQAWLLLGWMATRLRWAAESQPFVEITTTSEADSAPGDIASVRLDCVIGDETATVRVERHGDMLYTGFDVNGTISASRTLPVDSPDVVHLVGGLMEHPGEDPVYRDAVQATTELVTS